LELRADTTVDLRNAFGPVARRRRRAGGSDGIGVGTRPVEGPVFSGRARQIGRAWIGVALVLTALAGSAVETPTGFLVMLPLTSGLFTVPAIVVAAITVRRVVGPLQAFWRFYLGGNVALYVVGSAVVGYAVRPRWVYQAVAVAALAALMACDALAIDRILRVRSGARSRLVDLVESGLAIVLVTGPVLVVYGEQIRTSAFAWFGVISLICLVLFTSALWCTVVLFVRSPRGRRPVEGVGVALWVLAVLDSVIEIEQVVSGFSLPAVPVLVLNGLCMSLLLLLPLNTPHRLAPGGGENLPPRSQIRSGKMIAAITLAALPVLAGAVVVAGRTPAAMYMAGLALAALVALSAIRQLLTFSEARRLYGEVERSAEDRRALLAAVLESMNADRRRVAVELHQQASSSYAALASLVPTEGDARGRVEGARLLGVSDSPHHRAWAAHLRPMPVVQVSHLLTERMAAQAESLRELIGAIRPPVASEHAGLAPILQAYVDSLDVARPRVTRVEVVEGLVLDWVTETAALRVVQEAVRNTCLHAGAAQLHIELTVEDGTPVVRVSDDGVGFDLDAVAPGSGIATMRRFVDFCGGQLDVRSAIGEGTVVEARLGGAPSSPSPPARLRPVR
jgi:signal transduction histidine kinase